MELTYADLELQDAELLPSRETLWFWFPGGNFASVNAFNSAVAVGGAGVFGFGGGAFANANQTIGVFQF